jgi:hypothetical protein
MELQLAKIVNRGFENQPQHICLQILDTLRIIEFSEVKWIFENNASRFVSLEDNNIYQPEIKHILDNMGHEVNVSIDENNNVILHF